jgi:hypothetical protein
MCSIIKNDTEWNVVCSEASINEEVTNEEVTNEEVTNEEVTNEEATNEEATNEEVTNEEVTNEENTIYIILVNNKPYGCYYSEDETAEQLSNVKEYVREQHLYEFKKDYYWVNVAVDKYSDTILKTNLISNMKDIIVKYDYLEDTVEIVKSRLL